MDEFEEEQALIRRIVRAGAEITVSLRWISTSYWSVRNDKCSRATVPHQFRDLFGALKYCAKETFGLRLALFSPQNEAALIDRIGAEQGFIYIEIMRSEGNQHPSRGWQTFEKREPDMLTYILNATQSTVGRFGNHKTLLLGLKSAVAKADEVHALDTVAEKFIRYW